MRLTFNNNPIEEQVKKLTREREELQATVDSQEISPADVDRMNAERDQLAKTLNLMRTQLDDINKAVWNDEIALQKKMDALERSAEKFNAMLYKLDLLSSSDSRYSCLSKELELYVQHSRPENMVSVDLKHQVKVWVSVILIVAGPSSLYSKLQGPTF